MKNNQAPIISRADISIRPDKSVNNEEFARCYSENPGLWDKAFAFLKESDLKRLEKGRHELEGKDLFASIDGYLSRNEEDTRLETHRKYVDIQYVIAGEELIGLAPLMECTETTQYDDIKDICFLKSGDEKLLPATPDRYFIFFPSDAHRPCLKAGKNSPVKKVVIKVRIA